jgi:nickel-dependent lactate racemase
MYLKRSFLDKGNNFVRAIWGVAMLKFPYGKSCVALDIPRKNLFSVVESKITPSAEDEGEEVGRAIKNPIASLSLNNLVHKGDKIAILVSDITRAIPDDIVVPLVVGTLKEAGVAYADMEILIANGLHRSASRREMEELLGKEVLEKVAVLNHRCENDENLIDLGKTSF